MRTELVTTLKRRATELLEQLEADREPVLITQHGVPSAYLVDVESYEKMQRRVAVLEGREPAPVALERRPLKRTKVGVLPVGRTPGWL